MSYDEELETLRRQHDEDCPTCMTWRHEDGSIRLDHMDARLGDYFGPPPADRGAQQ